MQIPKKPRVPLSGPVSFLSWSLPCLMLDACLIVMTQARLRAHGQGGAGPAYGPWGAPLRCGTKPGAPPGHGPSRPLSAMSHGPSWTTHGMYQTSSIMALHSIFILTVLIGPAINAVIQLFHARPINCIFRLISIIFYSIILIINCISNPSILLINSIIRLINH